MIRFRLAAVMALVVATEACGSSQEEAAAPPPVLPRAEELSALEGAETAAIGRLLERHLDSGMVVSRTRPDDGSPRDIGDSAIFTGIALGALDCDRGRALLEGVLENIRDHDGMIYRHPRLDAATAAKHGPSSRDAMIGTAFGLVLRARNCPEDRAEIAEVWGLHRAFVKELGNGRLYPEAGEDKQINAGLWWLWDRVANYLGVTGEAPSKTKALWESGVVATAASVAAAAGSAPEQTACYPIHLTAIQYLTAVAIDAPPSLSMRLSWCAATRGTGIPMVEWMCSRESAASWLSTYSPDQPYVYRHQKCKTQGEDGTDVSGPGVDFIVLKRLASREAL